MASTHNWIIGRGLLGTAVTRAADAVGSFTASIDWSSPESTIRDLRDGLNLFAQGAGDDWAIYWCAGRGVTSTPRDAMLAEAAVFDAFLRAVGERLGESRKGRLFLASSVGGAYAGSGLPPFTESTPARALSPYGEAKLLMEESLRKTVLATGLRGFIARITNLYGPGQNLGKGQGLISVIIESYVTGKPVSIYVSLDTLRDYIYVDDCAKVIVAGTDRSAEQPAGTTTVKIVGAMSALSIGAIVGEIRRLRRKPVPIVLGQGNAVGQALDLRVRSEVWPDLDALVSTTLPEGLGAVYRAQLAAHMTPS